MTDTQRQRELQCFLLGFAAAGRTEEFYIDHIVKDGKYDWPELVRELPQSLDENDIYDAHLLMLFEEMQKALDERAEGNVVPLR